MAGVVVGWDDFTGGYWVGDKDADQPRNTWTGDNVWIDHHTGFLMAMDPINRTGVTYTNNPPQEQTFTYPIRINDGSFTSWIWAQGSTGRFYKYANGDVAQSGGTFSAFDCSDIVPAYGTEAGVPHAWITERGSGAVIRCNVSAMTVGTTIVPGNIGSRIVAWNDRMVSWTPGLDNVLYFSDATQYTSWPAINFVQIGDDATPIQAVVPTTSALLVLKPTGIWEVTGNLGTSTAIRQLTTDMGLPEGFERAHHLPGGITIYEGGGRNVSQLALSGLIPRVLNARSMSRDGRGTSDQSISRASLNGIYIGWDRTKDQNDVHIGRGWIYDSAGGRWARYTIPDAIFGDGDEATTKVRWAQDVANGTTNLGDEIVAVINAGSTLTRNEIIHFARDFWQDDPPIDATCTVELAEHVAPPATIEKPLKLLVEIVTPSTMTGYNLVTLEVRLRALGVPELVPAPASEPFSSTFRWQHDGNQLEAGTSYLAVFDPTDLPACTRLIPELTFTNCKLRRVLLDLDRDALRVS